MKSLNDVFCYVLVLFVDVLLYLMFFYKVSCHTQWLGVFKQMSGKFGSF